MSDFQQFQPQNPQQAGQNQGASGFDFLGSIGHVDVQTSEPVKPGVYRGVVIRQDNNYPAVVRNKGDYGWYLKLKWKVDDPDSEFHKRGLGISFHNLPINRNSPDWQKALQTRYQGDLQKMEEAQKWVTQFFFQDMSAITGKNWGDPNERPRFNPNDLVGCHARLNITLRQDDNDPNQLWPNIEDIWPLREESGMAVFTGQDSASSGGFQTQQPSQQQQMRTL